MESNEDPHSLQEAEHNVHIAVSWESEPQYDPLADHRFYTKDPRFEPQYTYSVHPLHNYSQQSVIHNRSPWSNSPQSVRRSSFTFRSVDRSIPRLRDVPRSAVAQRILKEQAIQKSQKSSRSLSESGNAVSLAKTIGVEDNGINGEESLPIHHSSLREEPNKSHVKKTVMSTPEASSALIDQTLIAQGLRKLMPTLDDLYVQPVNSHSIVCDKTTVMVQRVHEFARRVNENLGSSVFGTPFAHPDRLTAAILGLSWRAVKRAVEKPRVEAGPLPPCRAQHRPPDKKFPKEKNQCETSADTRIAIVKDYIVNRHTQSVCATKYNVKLSYVQYVVKRFRQTGILRVGDSHVDQNELPRESSGAIRESALIRRLNEMPDPPIMRENEKQLESDDHEEIEKKSRRGRKRKRFSSEDMEIVSKRSSLSVWSDIDDDDDKKNRLSTNQDATEEGISDESIDTNDTIDRMMLTDESISRPNSIDPEDEDVNILDSSSDDGEIHNNSN